MSALTLRVLDTQDVGPIDTFQFYAGEDRTLKLQVMDEDSGFPHQIPTGATLTLTLAGSPDDVEVANADITVDSTDRSIISVSLTNTQTDSMVSGDVQLEYVSGSTTRIAYKESILERLTSAL